MKTKHISTALLAVFVFCTGFFANAQQQDYLTKKEIKTYDKSVKYYKKAQKSSGDKMYANYDKAIATLQPVLTMHLKNEDVWTTMIEYYYSRYSAKAYIVELLQYLVEYGLKNAKTAEEKASYQNMKIDTTVMHEYKMALLDMCRQATFHCENQEYASIYIRLLMIEEKTNPDIDDDAIDKFNQAEDEYTKQNYLGAAKLYKEAYKLDSNYYRAVIKCGLSYSKNGDYDNSIPWFEKAVKMRPKKLEPRKYLVDVYSEQRKDQKSFDECVNAMLVHPEVGMFIRMETIAKHLGKTYNRHWMTRDYEPNKNLQVSSDSPWKYYYDAKKNISQYCDENGVITKENSLTKQKYTEAYCWEYMIQNSSDSRFSFAKKMMDAGYLDCYVLVSMYHINLNGQYMHLAQNDPEKVKKYISTYMLE